MNCPENQYFFNPPPRMEREGRTGGRGQGGRNGGRQAGKEGPERSRVTS